MFAPAAKPGPEGGHWREGLARRARTSWDIYHRHPWALEGAPGRPPLEPNVLGGLEAALQVVSALSLNAEQQLSVISLVDDYVHGAATDRINVSQMERCTGLNSSQWWRQYDLLLEEFVDFASYPQLTALWEALGPTKRGVGVRGHQTSDLPNTRRPSVHDW